MQAAGYSRATDGTDSLIDHPLAVVGRGSEYEPSGCQDGFEVLGRVPFMGTISFKKRKRLRCCSC